VQLDWTDTDLELQQLPASLTRLTQLTTLSLRGTVLYSGPLLSSLGDMSQLQILKLSGGPNNIGTLPPQWSLLQNLQQLVLYDMTLNGSLPASYANMTTLDGFRLYTSTFAQGAQLPSEWSAMKNLTQIDIRHVRGLSGSVPTTWKTGLPKLNSLALYNVTSLDATMADYWGVIARPGAPSTDTVADRNGLAGHVACSYAGSSQVSAATVLHCVLSTAVLFKHSRYDLPRFAIVSCVWLADIAYCCGPFQQQQQQQQRRRCVLSEVSFVVQLLSNRL
jgi:hypothetical protein